MQNDRINNLTIKRSNNHQRTLRATVVYSDNFDTSTVSFRNNFSNILGCIWLQERLKLIFIIKIINTWTLLRATKVFDLDNIGDMFRLPSQCDEKVRNSFSLSFRQHSILTESIDRVQSSIE